MGPAKAQQVAFNWPLDTMKAELSCGATFQKAFQGLLFNLDGKLTFDLKCFFQELWSGNPASRTQVWQGSQVALPLTSVIPATSTRFSA